MAKDLVEHQLYPSTPAANMNKANALACGCTIYSGRQIRKQMVWEMTVMEDRGVTPL